MSSFAGSIEKSEQGRPRSPTANEGRYLVLSKRQHKTPPKTILEPCNRSGIDFYRDISTASRLVWRHIVRL
ncbi:hypothetical protein TNCT_584371 [Trichonephila clavata]|uniref:Uncharacterized protein n=1 Tax=Trichonephila clavata TaxID=2740835 RepID=A0A8X6HC35_TRICU|nr:hypothetical protein TNCT_584371 [Trichonephila clavata]